MKFFIKDFFSKCDQIRRKLELDIALFAKDDNSIGGSALLSLVSILR